MSYMSYCLFENFNNDLNEGNYILDRPIIR